MLRLPEFSFLYNSAKIAVVKKIIKSMKKQPAWIEARQKTIILGLLALLIVVVIIIYFWQKPIMQARQQVTNYKTYQVIEQELAKVKRNEKDFIYYYAADGKRYVFQDILVFKSWFGDYPQEKIAFESSEAMSQSPLGGNVFLRPGSLLQSATLLDTFIVYKNANISPVADLKLLEKFYGTDWKNKVVILPDYYFSQYVMGKPIKSASDFPEIPVNLTIDQALSSK